MAPSFGLLSAACVLISAVAVSMGRVDLGVLAMLLAILCRLTAMDMRQAVPQRIDPDRYPLLPLRGRE